MAISIRANPPDQRLLYWAYWDRQKLAASIVANCLAGWSGRCGVRVQLRGENEPPGRPPPLGLGLWAVYDHSQLAATAAALAAQRESDPRTIRLVYVGVDQPQLSGCLGESGATLVVDQLVRLESAVMGLVEKMSLTNHGTHPLTGGLTERLPWATGRGR